MNDPRPTKLAVEIAALRASGTGANGGSFEHSAHLDALARALAAERRLECLVRLAAEIIPAQYDSGRESYRPPGAWRAFARELSRAKRHLSRTREHAGVPPARGRPPAIDGA